MIKFKQNLTKNPEFFEIALANSLGWDVRKGKGTQRALVPSNNTTFKASQSIVFFNRKDMYKYVTDIQQKIQQTRDITTLSLRFMGGIN